ncbi:N-acetylneuraminate synthase [bacterium K02(2017)]|nr:N-acetylneuraminate synthase [bacterium K02(2017)]
MNKTYIIAEIGVNHNGSIDTAKQLISIAKKAGVDAVKFQSFKAQKIVQAGAKKALYQVDKNNPQESQLEMLKALELSVEEHQKLITYCKESKIQFLSTAFDLESLELLHSTFDLPLFKIASGEITNAQLLFKIAQTQKPCILSTGMCSLDEIKMALSILGFGYVSKKNQPEGLENVKAEFNNKSVQEALQKNVTLLQCTTSYPTDFKDVNLLAMDTLYKEFGLSIGLSDHSTGILASVAAVSRGACVIEKHITLSRDLKGPDHFASIEPDELINMVKQIRDVELILGSDKKEIQDSELANKNTSRKSLVASAPIKAGERFSLNNLDCIRPGTGISAIYYWDYIGLEASKDYEEGELIQ